MEETDSEGAADEGWSPEDSGVGWGHTFRQQLVPLPSFAVCLGSTWLWDQGCQPGKVGFKVWVKDTL